MRYTTKDSLSATVLFVGGFLVLWFFLGWDWMIWIGMLHGSWWSVIPTISFKHSLILTFWFLFLGTVSLIAKDKLIDVLK